MSKYVDIEPLDFIAFTDKSEDFADGVKWAMEQVDKCAKRPEGEWIKDEYGNIICSVCRHAPGRIPVSMMAVPFKSCYCPNCGADMRKCLGVKEDG